MDEFERESCGGEEPKFKFKAMFRANDKLQLEFLRLLDYFSSADCVYGKAEWKKAREFLKLYFAG
jgi:hypothetical protein